MTKHERVLVKIAEVARHDEAVVAMLVIGSVAAGTHHAGSDLDVALVLREAPVPIAVRKELHDGLTVDRLSFTQDALRHTALHEPHLLHPLFFARVLFDDSGEVRDLLAGVRRYFRDHPEVLRTWDRHLAAHGEDKRLGRCSSTVVDAVAEVEREHGDRARAARLPAMLLAAALAAGCPTEATVVETHGVHQIEAAISRIELDVDSGGVEIASGDEIAVRDTTRYSALAPTLTVWAEDGVLHVESRCPQQSTCATDLVISVPAAIDAELEVGAGAIAWLGLDGDLAAHTGSGAILLQGSDGAHALWSGSGAILVDQSSGTLDAWTASGAIEVDGYTGEVSLESGSGDLVGTGLDAGVVQATTGGGRVILEVEGALEELYASTGTGSVALTVPAGSYQLDLQTGSGQVTTRDVLDAWDAPASIEARTALGDISVIGR